MRIHAARWIPNEPQVSLHSQASCQVSKVVETYWQWWIPRQRLRMFGLGGAGGIIKFAMLYCPVHGKTSDSQLPNSMGSTPMSGALITNHTTTNHGSKCHWLATGTRPIQSLLSKYCAPPRIGCAVEYKVVANKPSRPQMELGCSTWRHKVLHRHLGGQKSS